VSEKKGHGAITVAVADFLADLRLTGSERVLGAVALALAEGMDDSPAYARGKLARELREILAELAKAELSREPRAARRHRAVSDALDKHVANALAALDDVSVRQLHATAEALGRRRNGLRDFAGVFREVAWSRENDSDPHLARFHVREFVSRADDDLVARLEQAEAPFWRHVREAVLASRKEVETHR
jgi:hypothetical protein